VFNGFLQPGVQSGLRYIRGIFPISVLRGGFAALNYSGKKLVEKKEFKLSGISKLTNCEAKKQWVV
jgi:hypothetical protein